MGKYCVEEIIMGFAFPEPVSTFYGHFETVESAAEWARNKYASWEEINDSDTPFFQKDCGASVKEAYIQDCEDEDFLNYSKYNQSKIREVKGE